MKRFPPEQLRGFALLCPEERVEIISKTKDMIELKTMMRYEATVQALAAELRYQAYATNSGRCLLTLNACGELDGPQ